MSEFRPIKFHLAGWPSSVIDCPDSIDSIGLTNLIFKANSASRVVADGTIQLLEEIVFDLPLLPGLSLAFLEQDGSLTEVDFSFDFNLQGFSITIHSLSAAIRVQTTLLTTMEPNGDGFSPIPPDPVTGEPVPVEITLEGVDLSFNAQGEFDFIFAEDALALTISPFMIGDSGIIVEIQKLRLILSAAEAQTLPESIPSDSRGVFLEEATIHLPEGLADILPDEISFVDAFIGSGGFSGSVTAEGIDTYDEAQAKTLLGFGFCLQALSIEFKQNTITASSITGFLKIPFFDVPIEVTIGLANDGNFTIAIDNLDGVLTLTKPNIISIDVTSLEFLTVDGVFSIKLSGSLTPLIAGITWPSFELKGLTIGTDGTVKVDGGWIELPEQKGLDFHGFKIEIAKLGFGSDEVDGDQYKWVGFSGGIQIIESLPLKGGVEGLKVMWAEVDGDVEVKLKIGGIYLAFEIKDVLTFDGSVYFIDEPDRKEFRGGIDLSIIPINLGIDAQFITGRTLTAPIYNYFYIAIGLDLPVGIPLGSPVLGLYGIAGLYGQNMKVNYQDTDQSRITDAGNWTKQQDAFAFGAGITVGTLPDAKFNVKAKVLFVILFPGPVLLLEGEAGILSTADNYQMKVLAVLDTTVGSFLMNITAGYQFPSGSGELVDIAGSAEAFFSAGDPNNWHLYLGQDTPEAKRIRADILSLFKAQTYLMVDGKGLAMGAWIGYGLDKKYGILRVVLEAWISGSLSLSTMPLQAKGSITLYGNAELSASIVKLGISVEATVSAQAPKPLSMHASMEVQLKTPLGKPKATISLKWENTKVPPYPIPLSTTLGVEHRKVSKTWQVSKYSLYSFDTDGLYTTDLPSWPIPAIPVVPPDVYLSLSFDKPVIDVNYVGTNPVPMTSTYEKVGDYEFKYELIHVTLQCRDDWGEQNMDESGWMNYMPTTGDYQFTGYWQFMPGPQNNTKLLLNATTPFEISRLLDSSDIWYTMLGVYNPNYPCVPIPPLEELCVDFETRALDIYYYILEEKEFIFTSPYPLLITSYGNGPVFTGKALTNVDAYDTIECVNIKAQEPTGQINIKVINQVIFTAGLGYDSYLQLTDEYSLLEDTEMYINQSLSDPPLLPAAITFPRLSFPDLPLKVWITCYTKYVDGVIFRAYDENNNQVDQCDFVFNEWATVYELSADVPIRKITMYGDNLRILEVCYEHHHVVETDSILVTPPQQLVTADIKLTRGSTGTIFLYNSESREVRQVEFSIPANEAEDTQYASISLEDETPFRSFLVNGNFAIISICGVTAEARDIFEYNSELTNHYQTTLDETWGQHAEQILEPNKYYRLVIETASSRRKNNDDWDTKSFTEYMFFKTGNPPGDPALTQTEVGEDTTLRYDLVEPLNSLASYIDYPIPSGAAADEAQYLVYRTYDVGLVYNDSYIEQMYFMADKPLSIQVLDNNNLPATNAAGDALTFVNQWGDNPALTITREEERFEEILLEGTCLTMVTESSETEEEAVPPSRELLMKPLTQYKAQLLASTTSVYEFTFLTSRYTSFRHHIHSFEGILWNHYDLLQNDTYEIDRNVLQQVLDNSEVEGIKFEQLMQVFDLNPRVLPERLEVTLLNDESGGYAFLIETPEPFDWNRTTINLFYSNMIEVPGIVDDAVVLCGGSSSLVNNDFNNQWIDILLQESIDLCGFIIEAGILPDQESFETYYVFEDPGIVNAGTWIRVFNGMATASTEEPENDNIYSGYKSDLAAPNGRIIRLKNNEGEIIQTYVLYNDTVWNTAQVQQVKSDDGSRCCLVFNENEEAAPGIYECRFTFNRDIGVGFPVLKRFGFANSEEAAIRFAVT